MEHFCDGRHADFDKFCLRTFTKPQKLQRNQGDVIHNNKNIAYIAARSF